MMKTDRASSEEQDEDLTNAPNLGEENNGQNTSNEHEDSVGTSEPDDVGGAQTEGQNNDETIINGDTIETSSSNDNGDNEDRQETVDTSDSNDDNDGQSTLDENDEAIVEALLKKVVETLSASGISGSEH